MIQNPKPSNPKIFNRISLLDMVLYLLSFVILISCTEMNCKVIDTYDIPAVQ